MREPTNKELYDACMTYRHDFGLLEEKEQKELMVQAKEWFEVWNKIMAPIPAKTVAITDVDIANALSRKHYMSPEEVRDQLPLYDKESNGNIK